MTSSKIATHSLSIAVSVIFCSIYLGEGWQIIDYEKPYIYRQLVPLLSLVLTLIFNISNILSTKIIIFISAIGLAEASLYLYNVIFPNKEGNILFVIIHVMLVFLLASFPPHTYDIPTAFLFTLSFALLKDKRFFIFSYLFPLVVLNRETAFLLPILFFVYFWDKLSARTLYSLSIMYLTIFISIQFAIRYALKDIPVTEVQKLPTLLNFSSLPSVTYLIMMSHIIIVLLFISLVVEKWPSLQQFLKMAVIIFVPILSILYFMFGHPFEFRVFLEALPILILVGMPQIRSTYGK